MIDRYEKGYSPALTREQKQEFREAFHAKSPFVGISLTLLHISMLYAALIGSFLVLQSDVSIWFKGGSMLLACLIAIRQMRALENIVHFGSHHNFSRHKRFNDLATNLLAAWPMLQDVGQYRKYHALHHGQYGSDVDPCLTRLRNIGAGDISIGSNRELLFAVLRWMPLYVREYYREVRSKGGEVALFLLWHGVVALSIAIIVSPMAALFVLCLWGLAMFGLLPLLRSVAEYSEHDYERGSSVCDTTFNNIGLLDHLLIHPAGDAWHTLHHLYPNVPWWLQGAAHRYLMRHDVAYAQVLNRDGLLQDLASFRPDCAREAIS